MPLSTAEQAALDRLRSYYEGDNPYNSVSNPGGFRQGGHLYNFVPALKDLAVVIVGAARLATEVAANSVQSPKAVRVDSDQAYTADEQARGRANLGLATVLTAYLAKAGGVMTGDLKLKKDYPGLQFQHLEEETIGFQLSPGGTLRWVNFSNGNPYHQFVKDGSFWIAQFGDLNTRIESRGTAYRDAAIAATLPRTGGEITGRLTSTFVSPHILLKNTGSQTPNKGWAFLNNDADGRMYIQSWTGDAFSANIFNLATDGTLWTSQLGDLNTRIETRASAIADNRLATARSEFFPKTGGTTSGEIAAPFFTVTANAGSGFNYGSRDGTPTILLYNATNRIRFWSNGDLFSVGTDGSLSTSQFGDLNTRIEARGAAYQAAAQAASVAKTGDTMSGDLQINGNSGSASPGVRFVYPSNADWLIRSIGDNQLQFCDGARSIQYFAFSANGAINTRQFGDLNARIEARGSAWADNAVNRSVTSCRWAFVGDLYNSYNLNNGMAEPYGGSAMTGRATYADGTANGAWIPGIFRWRQLQIYIPNQGWVATYFS